MQRYVALTDTPNMATPVQHQFGTTILVIDDDVSILNMSARVLQKEGYHVLVAANASEALRVATDHPSAIDLLLTDVMLPSGNGMSVARALLKQRPNTPILYMSGFHADAIQAVQAEGGPNGGFLEKPFSAHVLADRVRGIVAPSAHHFQRAVVETVKAPEPVTEVSAQPTRSDAMYQLESPVRCPHCEETISSLKAVRLLRTQVNFTSTLPRRGRVLTCPSCLSILPAELTNF
jgi:DNA-binding response OmpR family regulator